MFLWVGRRFTYANVVMTFVLVFAMSGGAYAAKRYLITSTKQISPSVLKQLRGKAGSVGASGVQGAVGSVGPQGAAGVKGEPGVVGKEGPAGKDGENGKEGSPWTAGGTLPSGKTLKGDWGIGQGQGLLIAGVSFGISLESAPIPVYLKPGGTSAHCPGSVASPGAEPGYLCVFVRQEEHMVPEAELDLIEPGIQNPKICSSNEGLSRDCALTAKPASDDPAGFEVVGLAETDGFALGSWAVTAE